MRLPRHATVVAYLALFVALGGTSFAAISITGKNVKNSSLTGKDIKNSSLSTSDVKNKSLLAKDFKAGQLPQGPQGPQGAKGADFTAGSSLRSGEVLNGPFGVGRDGSAAGGTNYMVTGIQFAPHLAADLCAGASCVEYLPAATTSATCPGVGQAAAGHLCFYEAVTQGTATFVGAYDPAGGVQGVRRWGTTLFMSGDDDPGYVRGTWTLKAP
jgi:hypothetical protein